MSTKDALRGVAILAALLTTIVALLILADVSEARKTARDTTTPNTRVESSPGSPTNKTTATFAFYSSEPSGAGFECSLDGGRFRSCESPAGHENLAEGRHNFKTRSIDASGNVDPTLASRSWTVDLTSPQTLLTAGGGGRISGATARFEFSADEPVSGFYCSLDGAPPSRCASPQGYASLSVGGHDFEVYARDRAGNVDPTPETASWTVVGDAAPVVTIEGAPRIEGYHEYHHFRFSADVAGSSFYCSLDEEPFAPCVSGAYRHVPYGQHSFAVYAVGPGGVGGEAAVVEYESRDPNWD